MINRIDERMYNIWYIPLIAGDNPEKFEAIRNSRQRDVLNSLISILKNQ